MTVGLVIVLVLGAVCVARAEHVIASGVWVAVCGERFKELEAKKIEARKLIGGPSLAWKDVRVTPEERWSLYKQTDGGRLPWLFFGIRSHRLLVAARARKGPTRIILILVRLTWLNWSFPLWMGILLMVVAAECRFGEVRYWATVGAVVLCVNTCGTMIGGFFSEITMGGLTRHHDSAGVDMKALSNGITEICYSLAADVLFLWSCAVAIQLFGLTRTGPSVASLAASASFVITGATSSLIPLKTDWQSTLALLSHVLFGGTVFLFGFSVQSATRRWMRPAPETSGTG